MYIKYTKKKIEEAVKQSTSLSEVIRLIGANTGSGGVRTLIKSKIEKYNIDISHFSVVPKRPENWRCWNKKDHTQYLIKRKGRNRQSARILRRCLGEIGIPYECSCCHISDWQNNHITLQIDHINGNFLDDRAKNLRYLCPNCHSQTPTWSKPKTAPKENFCKCGIKIALRSKKCRTCANRQTTFNQRRVKNRPSLKSLEVSVKKIGYVGTSKKYGVSDNTIRKWISRYKKDVD